MSQSMTRRPKAVLRVFGATLVAAGLVFSGVGVATATPDAPPAEECVPQDAVPAQGEEYIWVDNPDYVEAVPGTPAKGERQIKELNPDYVEAVPDQIVTHVTKWVWTGGPVESAPQSPLVDPTGWNNTGRTGDSKGAQVGVVHQGNGKGSYFFYSEETETIQGTPAQGEEYIWVDNPDYVEAVPGTPAKGERQIKELNPDYVPPQDAVECPEEPTEPEEPTVVVPEVPQCVAGSFVLPSNTEALTYALSSDGTTVRVMSDTATVQAGNGWVVVQGDFGGASVLEFTGTCEPTEPEEPTVVVPEQPVCDANGLPVQPEDTEQLQFYTLPSGLWVTSDVVGLKPGNGWERVQGVEDLKFTGSCIPANPEEPTVVVPEQPVCNKHGETLLPADTDTVKYEFDGDAKLVTATIIKPGFTFDENELNGYKVGYVDDETGVVAVLTFDVSDCKPADNGGGEPNPTNPGGNNGGNQPPANPNPGNNGGGNQPPSSTPTPVDNPKPVTAPSGDSGKKADTLGAPISSPQTGDLTDTLANTGNNGGLLIGLGLMMTIVGGGLLIGSRSRKMVSATH